MSGDDLENTAPLPAVKRESVEGYYGKDEPSATYKWAVVSPGTVHGFHLPAREAWQAVAWFKTRKAAEDYGRRTFARFAVARGFW